MVNLVLYGDAGACIDIDGNVYETVQIGDQLWMAENLKVTHYNNGDEIPTVISNEEWLTLNSGAFSDYLNNPANSETYGRLYNFWVGIDSRSVCPEGWHIPSNDEWNSLTNYLGGVEIAGGKNLISSEKMPSRKMQLEEIRDADPDVIVIMPCGFDVKRTIDEYNKTLAENKGWNDLRAVKENNVYAVDANSYFSKPSLRTVTGIEILASIFHPEIFKGLEMPENSYMKIN